MVRKSIKVAAAAALIITGASYFYRPEKITQAPFGKEAADASSGLEQKVTAFSIEGRSPQGARQWNLNGESAEIVGEDIYLNSLSAVVYNDESVVNLSSDSGVYRRTTGEVELIGNVRVFSGEEFTLLTDSARWVQEDKIIRTDDIVEISREGLEAVGKGGSANSDEKWAKLNSEVRVFISPDTRVRSDGPLEVRYDENVAVFRDGVIVEDKEGRLLADMLTVEFDPETKKLSRVTAEGNVKVKKGNTYTLSEKAVYTEGTKSAELLGRPRVIIDPAEIENFDKMAI
jgi:LPS export ABC transporter protein LptC